MRKLKHDFKGSKNTLTESYYDLVEDWSLIESSLAKQYGIRIRQCSDMPWDEFCSLLSGFMPDTPLGNIVAIRSESDPKVLKNFTKEQRLIRNNWKKHLADNMLQDTEALDKQMEDLSKMLSKMFSDK